jgi:GR25 family glycosyltransferase involved in LPS biosynthesis
MNRILDLVDTPYWFHLEDDWQFVVPDHYVTKLLAVLDADPTIGQVLVNRNYAETLADAGIVGGFVRATDDGLRYRLHGHAAIDSEEYRAFFAEQPPGTLANVWWPHYSLRPALVRTEAARDVGRFDPHAEHFELEYAQRWNSRGHQSAFLDAVHCVHIGRLTTEPHTGVPNAYDLNEQPQFGRAGAGPVAGVAVPTEVRVVNLERRADRWEAFVATVRARAGDDFADRLVRHDAVDATTLTPTPEVAHRFRGNDFGNRRSFVACALSHLAVWQEAAAADTGQFLVFEDDAELVEDFADRFDELMESLRDGPGYDLLLLGYLPWAGDDAQVVATPELTMRARPIDWSDYLGGLFAYVVTPVGARALLARAERDGIRHGVDWFVMKQNADLRVLHADPALAWGRHAKPGSGVDSDIQYDGVPLW